MPVFTLGEIASRVAGHLVGDPDRRIAGVAPLDAAGPEDLSFLAHPRHREAARASRAAALIVPPSERLAGRDLILSDSPYTALATAMRLFHPERRPQPGVDPRAVVSPEASVAAGASVGPLVVIGRQAKVEEGAVLMAGVVLGDGAEVGRESVLHPGVVLYPGVRVGARVVIHAGSVLGSDGFGFGEAEGGRAKIPQVGTVRVEDDVEIGACVTIDRATFGATVVGRGARIDNLVQIGHNVQIGEGCVLVAQTGIAGSTRLGRGVIMAGQSGAAGHLTLGEGAIVGAKSAVLQDLPAGAYVVGHPAMDHRAWKRAQAALRRLPDVLRRLNALEAAGARRGRTASVPTRPAVRRAGRRAPRSS